MSQFFLHDYMPVKFIESEIWYSLNNSWEVCHTYEVFDTNATSDEAVAFYTQIISREHWGL